MKFLVLICLCLSFLIGSDNNLKVLDNTIISKDLDNNKQVYNADYLFNSINVISVCKDGFKYMIFQIGSDITVTQVKETVEVNNVTPYDRFVKCN